MYICRIAVLNGRRKTYENLIPWSTITGLHEQEQWCRISRIQALSIKILIKKPASVLLNDLSDSLMAISWIYFLACFMYWKLMNPWFIRASDIQYWIKRIFFKLYTKDREAEGRDPQTHVWSLSLSQMAFWFNPLTLRFFCIQIMIGEGILFCWLSKTQSGPGAEANINAAGCNFNSYIRRAIRFVGKLHLMWVK